MCVDVISGSALELWVGVCLYSCTNHLQKLSFRYSNSGIFSVESYLLTDVSCGTSVNVCTCVCRMLSYTAMVGLCVCVWLAGERRG